MTINVILKNGKIYSSVCKIKSLPLNNTTDFVRKIFQDRFYRKQNTPEYILYGARERSAATVTYSIYFIESPLKITRQADYMKYLLLDTNIYLHYKDFEQIDWDTIVNDKDFTIIVPYTVVKEIDKCKDGPRGKIKTRAKSVSSKFGDYFLNDNYQKKLKLIQIDDPSDEVLSMNNLNRNICDDVIIGSVLAFGHRNDIIIISHDNTLLIKAKKFGLRFLPKMPEKYLIAEEKSEEEKELERCHKELMHFKNRQPQPKIMFANGKTVLRIKVPNLPDIKRELDEIMTENKANHPHAHKSAHKLNSPIRIEDVSEVLAHRFNDLRYVMYSEEQLKKHNAELDKYYAYCEKYHRFRLEGRQLEEQVKELQFITYNGGSAETGNMNIFLEFPGNVRLYNRQSIKHMNDIKPVAPVIGCRFSEYGHGGEFRYAGPRGGLDIPQLYCWDLTKYLSQQKISVTSESLIHNVPRPLSISNSLYIDTKQCGSFAINWHICAAGCIDRISGILNVIIESD